MQIFVDIEIYSFSIYFLSSIDVKTIIAGSCAHAEKGVL